MVLTVDSWLGNRFCRNQVRWSSIPISYNFPQLVEIHAVKCFSVNEADVDSFLEFSCFFYKPLDAGILISGSSAFSKSSLNIWKFLVHILWKPSLKNFEHYFASVWNECTCVIVWNFFGTALLWDWDENWLFQACGHCCFQIFWHIECSTFTASSFRIWNTSTGIPSPPLAFFIVMLPKAHLTSHCRISGSRWLFTSLWLSGSLRSFSFYSSSVYSHHLFIISSVLYCLHFCMKCSLGISNFLEEISSLLCSTVFLFSLHWSLRKAFLSLLAVLWISAFSWVYLSFSPLPSASLLFSAIFKSLSDKHFASLHFFLLWIVLITASCMVLWTSIHSSSDILSDLITWIYLWHPLYSHKGFDLDHTWIT